MALFPEGSCLQCHPNSQMRCPPLPWACQGQVDLPLPLDTPLACSADLEERRCPCPTNQ